MIIVKPVHQGLYRVLYGSEHVLVRLDQVLAGFDHVSAVLEQVSAGFTLNSWDLLLRGDPVNASSVAALSLVGFTVSLSAGV